MRERGSQAWVATRVAALDDADNWARTSACRDLIEWLYMVGYRRVKPMGLSPDERAEVVQDAMTPVVRALGSARERLVAAKNPAAFLERVMERAVAEARRDLRMAGLGGVPPNGKNWNTRYPLRIAGDEARLLLEEGSLPVVEPGGAVEQSAELVSEWISDHIEVTLTASALDALLYVLDRLVAGVGRPTLLRGGSSCLRRDPALRHLGFSEVAASAFAVWLLGRQDSDHHCPPVLDAVLGDDVDDATIRRWRTVATSVGFANHRDCDGSDSNSVSDRHSA